MLGVVALQKEFKIEAVMNDFVQLTSIGVCEALNQATRSVNGATAQTWNVRADSQRCRRAEHPGSTSSAHCRPDPLSADCKCSGALMYYSLYDY